MYLKYISVKPTRAWTQWYIGYACFAATLFGCELRKAEKQGMVLYLLADNNNECPAKHKHFCLIIWLTVTEKEDKQWEVTSGSDMCNNNSPLSDIITLAMKHILRVFSPLCFVYNIYWFPLLFCLTKVKPRWLTMLQHLDFNSAFLCFVLFSVNFTLQVFVFCAKFKIWRRNVASKTQNNYHSEGFATQYDATQHDTNDALNELLIFGEGKQKKSLIQKAVWCSLEPHLKSVGDWKEHVTLSSCFCRVLGFFFFFCIHSSKH